MARAKTNKLYRTFTKGLITEAGFLTYPEDASTDELNTVIKVKGSRSRRFGIDYEPSTAAGTISGLAATDVFTEFSWKNASNDSTNNFLAVQIKDQLYFYSLDAIPIAGSLKSFSIDLQDYITPAANSADVGNFPVQMASGKGFLFVCSPYIEPIIVEYSKALDDITVVPLIILVRDFDGVDDSLSTEAQPSSLSAEHYYNLRNQGWVQPGPLGVVDGTPATPNTGTPPAGSESGVGGGGSYYRDFDGTLDSR